MDRDDERGRRLAFLAPMPPELRPLVRALRLRRSPDDHALYVGRHGEHDVVATVIGIGPEPARRRTEAVLDAHEIGHVIVIGVAGGLAPHVGVGDVVVPATVIDAATGAEFSPSLGHTTTPVGAVMTTHDLVKERDTLTGLAERGVHALDMETAAVAQTCEARGVPWSAYRGISDDAFDPAVDDDVLGLTRSDGTADLAAVARFLATRPSRVMLLRRLARDLRAATTAAVDAALADHP